MINGRNTTVTGTRHFFGLRRPVHVSEDCKLCHIIIIPRHSNLMNHETNEKHREFHQQDKLPSKLRLQTAKVRH